MSYSVVRHPCQRTLSDNSVRELAGHLQGTCKELTRDAHGDVQGNDQGTCKELANNLHITYRELADNCYNFQLSPKVPPIVLFIIRPE